MKSELDKLEQRINEHIALVGRLRQQNKFLVDALRRIDTTLSGSLPVTAEVKAIARAAIYKFEAL